jgi:mono/diheme cytochrome c family protein
MKFAAALLLVATTAAAADGPALFKQNCAPCHGTDGSANTPAGKSLHARDLRSPEVQKLSDAAIAKQIREGKNKMPAFKNLDEGQVAALVGFVRGLAKR